MSQQEGLTITADKFAEQLSELTNIDIEICTQFIKAYFDEIQASVAENGRLEIKGFGVFEVIDGVTDNVQFTPAAKLASAINSPFEAFKPVALETGEMEEDSEAEKTQTAMAELNESAPIVATEEIVEETVAPIPSDEKPAVDSADNEDEITEPTEKVAEVTEVEQSVEPQAEETIESEAEEIDEPATAQAHMHTPRSHHSYVDDIDDEPQEPEVARFPRHRRYYRYRHRSKCRSTVWMIVMFFLGLLVGIFIGYLCYHKLNAFFDAPMSSDVTLVYNDTKDTVTASVDKEDKHPAKIADKAEENKEEPSPAVAGKPDTAKADNSVETKEAEKPAPAPRQPRYDKVTKTVYLATLARKYYGQGDYWVYIYEANKLKHPDRVAPGTTLRIPYTDELPLTGNVKEDIKKARRKGQEIYERYR